eukprot:EG_transcript_50536
MQQFPSKKTKTVHPQVFVVILLRRLGAARSIPATPSSSPYTGSIQDSYRDRFGDSERGGGFPWTTCSSITNSAFLESTATSDLFVESLTENGGDALANLIARGTSGYHLDPEPSAEL